MWPTKLSGRHTEFGHVHACRRPAESGIEPRLGKRLWKAESPPQRCYANSRFACCISPLLRKQRRPGPNGVSSVFVGFTGQSGTAVFWIISSDEVHRFRFLNLLKICRVFNARVMFLALSMH